MRWVSSAEGHATVWAVLVASLLLVAGCGTSNQGSGVSHTSGVIASLTANANISHAQLATFHADVRSKWAVAYDPAIPAGCVPGGIEAGVGSPPVAQRPCKVYVLERLKMTWMLRAVGTPGQMTRPSGAPSDLGHPDRLQYLGAS